MENLQYWTGIIAIVISIFATIYAKKSAEEAKKSRLSAEKSTLIAKVDLLTPHFTNIGYLLEITAGKIGSNKAKMGSAAESIPILKSFLSNKELNVILDEITSAIEEQSVCLFDPSVTPNLDNEMKLLNERMNKHFTSFNNIRTKYLSIGLGDE